MLHLQPYHRALLLTPDDASPLDSEEDPEEDSKEDHADYPADGGDDDDDESSDDDDDDEEEEQEAFEDDDEEEEEHPTLADSPAVPVDDLVPSTEDIEAFETDESVPTPVPSPRRRTYMISVRSQTPMSAATEALIAAVYVVLPSSPLPSPLTSLLSPLPHISSPPLPVPSPPLPLPSPPTHTSPTYAKAPLGYRAVGIRLRAASPPTHHPSEIPSPPLLLPSTTHKDDLPEVDMPLRKRARFTAPTGRFEVGKSSAAAATRHPGLDVATVDATLRGLMSREFGYKGERRGEILGTDISKITRKPSKTGKHGHGKRESTKEAKDSKPKPRKVNSQEKLVISKALISSLSSNATLDLVKAQREWKFVLATHSEEAQGVSTRIATLAIRVSSDLI
ncbi:hypothetical protein Tco_0731304 [Tanacetum coccineum]